MTIRKKETKPILEVKNLSKNYKDIQAVKDVSFSICPGEIVGLLGPNGAGKTTTISMVLGILEPSEGKIYVNDNRQKTHRSQNSEIINFSAVYTHVPDNMSVVENLRFFGLLYTVPDLRQRISGLLREFDLERFAHTKAGLLSSGEKSRLNLAKALINQPRLLLLDEPTASLDPSVAEDIRGIIKKYVESTQAAVLWTSHNMGEIEKMCSRVMFLSHGRILLSGNPQTLAQENSKKDLEELFISVAREPLSFNNNHL